MPNLVYEQLLADITDAFERKVLEVLLSGERIDRPSLVMKLFGYYCPVAELGTNKDDRRIRLCIERLRSQGWPIVSTSGEAGYKLEDDPDAIAAYAREQDARAAKERARAKDAYLSMLVKAHVIREARLSGNTAKQGRLL